MLRRLGRHEEGAAAVEYALLAGMVAVTLVATLGAVGQGVDRNLQDVASEVPRRIHVRT